jgi:DNA ligase 4
MPLLFSSFCGLLSELESQKLRDPPFLLKDLDQRCKKTIISWFNKHQHTIHASDTNGVAILSALFPEKRTDRVYWIKEKTLANILKRCLGLGTDRKKLLDEWNVPGKGDLGSCVERAMRQTDDSLTRKATALTVDEIDEVLAELGHKGRGEHGPNTQTMLSNIYRRLHSHEGKWLTRLILKDFSPVILPCDLVLRCFHFLLPDLLMVQDSFDAAMEMLRDGPLKKFPARPDRINETALRLDAAKHLRPKMNVKIGRAVFQKARSLKHCVDMSNKRFMSVQRKYDGEYCQVHIDLSRGQGCIKIFAKSGKDATRDRAGVHDAIRRSLRIGQEDCQFKSRCVLDGELLVYSDKENKIMDFNRIRRYVSRSGVSIGTERDSP